MARKRSGPDGRLSRQGNCAVCRAPDVKVAWRADLGQFQCYDCWPLKESTSAEKQAAEAYNDYFESLRTQNMGGHETTEALRDAIYGPHIEDSRTSECDFAVRCPCRG